eukprot:Polyplicarium_translucidae@DN2864_c0_g1_i12.p2
MFFCFFIYHRQYCVYFTSFSQPHPGSTSLRFELRAPSVSEQKLLAGLLFSLKSFCQKLSPNPPGSASPFTSFSTKLYKAHCFETANGYKFVMMTDPKVSDLTEFLGSIYRDVFVPQVVNSPSFELGTPVLSQGFTQELKMRVQRNLSQSAASTATVSQ